MTIIREDFERFNFGISTERRAEVLGVLITKDFLIVNSIKIATLGESTTLVAIGISNTFLTVT